jgi:hypothetical protein
MNSRLAGAIAVSLSGLCATPTFGQGTETWETMPACRARLKSDVKCFVTHARTTIAVCSMEWKLAGMNGRLDRAHACVTTSQEAMAPFYKAALTKLGKNKNASAALTEAHSYWVSAVRGLVPTKGETVSSYQTRSSKYAQGVDQRLTRLETEQ